MATVPKDTALKAYATIDDLPQEILFLIFHQLPKNVAASMWYPPPYTAGKILTRKIPTYTKRWLFGRVFVIHSDLHVMVNWDKKFLNQWLLMSPSVFDKINQRGFTWPNSDILVERDDQLWPQSRPWAQQKYTYAKIAVSHMLSTPEYMPVGARMDPEMESLPRLLSPTLSDHVSRLTLQTFNYHQSNYPYKLKVDSLQLNGSHIGIERIIDLSWVKQLTVLAKDATVYRYAQEFTRLTNLFVRYHIGDNGFVAFATTVRWLVMSIPFTCYDYTIPAALATDFELLTHFEVTSRVELVIWPRIWHPPDDNRELWQRTTHAEGARLFQEKQFRQLRMLVLDDHLYVVIRRNGRWVASHEVKHSNLEM